MQFGLPSAVKRCFVHRKGNFFENSLQSGRRDEDEAAFHCGWRTFNPFSGRKRYRFSVDGKHFMRFQFILFSVIGARKEWKKCSTQYVYHSIQQASFEIRSDGHKQKDRDEAEGNNFYFLLFCSPQSHHCSFCL